LLRASGLATDHGGAAHAFVGVKVHGQKTWKSQVVRASNEPIWDERYDFAGMLGEVITNPMLLKVLDRDNTRTVTIGELKLPLDSLTKQPLIQLQQRPLEGANAHGTLSLNIIWIPQNSSEAAVLKSSPSMPPSLSRQQSESGSTPLSTGLALSSPLSSPLSDSSNARSKQVGELEIHLSRASNLSPIVPGAFPDVVVAVKVGKSMTWMSAVARKTLNPVWNEKHVVIGRLGDLISHKTLIKVVDRSSGEPGEDLGKLQVDLRELLSSDKVDFDKMPLVRKHDGAEQAHGDISFSIVWTEKEHELST